MLNTTWKLKEFMGGNKFKNEKWLKFVKARTS